MRLYVVNSCIGVQRDEGDHIPLMEKPIGRIIIHGSVCKEISKGDLWIELSDLVQGEDS